MPAMYKLRNRADTPPGGFSWTDPVTMQFINARNFSNWITQANALRVANRQELPTEQEMEDQLCSSYDPKTRAQVCLEVDGNELNPILGVGGELKRLLAACGVKACWSCVDMARQMDDWGPDECERRRTEIVAGMVERANSLNWWRFVPFKEKGTDTFLTIAIERARRAH